MKYFGNKLKELREERKMTQLQLAKILFVSQRTIFAWENDVQEPNLTTIVKLANFFEVSTDFLLGKD